MEKYTETPNPSEQSDLANINIFMNHPTVQNLRNQYHADVCVLIMNSLYWNGLIPCEAAIPASNEMKY